MNEIIQVAARRVRALLLDIDGVLASPQLLYSDDGNEIKTFHIRDGLGIQLLHQAGIHVGVISGRQSKAAEKRLQELNVQSIFLGQQQKIPAYETIKNTLSLNDDEIAYMGDDLPDIPLLKRVGLPITLNEAPEIVKQHAIWHVAERGGNGAVRIVCEQLLIAQNRYENVLQSYFST